MTTCIPLSYANLRILKNAPNMINVDERITVLNVSIIKISTRLNSVIVTPTKSQLASMENIVPLHIRSRTLKSASFIICSHSMRISISTFSTSKPNGAPTITNIIKLSAFMRTIFRISEENQIFLDTRPSSAKTGKVALLSLAMRKVVRD